MNENRDFKIEVLPLPNLDNFIEVLINTYIQ